MKKLLSGLLVIAAFFVSCSKDNNPDSTFDVPVKVQDKVYFASSLPSVIDKALHMSVNTVTTNPDEAGVIIVKTSDLSAYEDLVKSSWEKGKIIVEVYPDNAVHKDFWTSIGAPSPILASEESGDMLLLAMQHFQCYCMMDPMGLDGHLSDLDIEEDEQATDSDEDDWEDGDIETVDIEEDAEYLASRMTGFVEWLNKNVLTVENGDEKVDYSKFIGDLTGYLTDKKFTQIYETSFSVGADNYRLCKVRSSSPDCVTRHSTVKVELTITPVYAYEFNGNDAGDYYFVTIHVLSENKPLYGLYKKKHGGVKTLAHAFYSENIKWTANIVPETDYSVGFFQYPSPSTTTSSTSYTSGFSTAVNVTGQAGGMGGKPSGSLTVGNTFTWNNSESRSLSDQMISENTSGGVVDYEFICPNVSKDDDVNKAVSLTARSNQHCYASWCWHVTGLKDNSDKKFKMTFTIDPVYGYMYRHGSWWAEGHIRHDVHLLPENDRTVTFELNPPDRRPAGVLEYTSTNSNYLNNIRVYDSNGKEAGSALSAYRQDVAVNFQLLTGVYSLEFDVRTGNGDFIERRRRENIKIRAGQTTHLASLDSTQVVQVK